MSTPCAPASGGQVADKFVKQRGASFDRREIIAYNTNRMILILLEVHDETETIE